ncbi:MAG: hypothetical protein NTX36_13625 [Proteobacteria bacterium]|nr:hypothetical protein [Pseudomonadota bacterium]
MSKLSELSKGKDKGSERCKPQSCRRRDKVKGRIGGSRFTVHGSPDKGAPVQAQFTAETKAEKRFTIMLLFQGEGSLW